MTESYPVAVLILLLPYVYCYLAAMQLVLPYAIALPSYCVTSVTIWYSVTLLRCYNTATIRATKLALCELLLWLLVSVTDINMTGIFLQWVFTQTLIIKLMSVTSLHFNYNTLCKWITSTNPITFYTTIITLNHPRIPHWSF